MSISENDVRQNRKKLICLICKSKLSLISRNLKTASSRADKILPFSIYECVNCGHLQKDVGAKYRKHLDDVYKTSYTLPGGGKKTNIVNGHSVSREMNLAKNIAAFFHERSDLSVLDVGTGEGYLLKAFSDGYPNFKLSGFDITREKEALIRKNGATNFYHEDLATITDRFDVITFNHVVEHLPDPVGTLTKAVALLKPKGIIAVIVPCFELVYSDFFFSEHCSHFTEKTLNVLSAFSGLSILDRMEGRLGAIEIGFLANRSQRASPVSPMTAINWTESLPTRILENGQDRTLGIFGLNGVGMWLGAVLKNKISFFVDDDPNKQGNTFSGCPIVSVNDIPKGSLVVVALNNPEASVRMLDRLKTLRPDISFLSSP
jgi:2-polyprenyl-3-methyl-5-hydroxy-6-metoxy-1,4-benzoquinol methylase